MLRPNVTLQQYVLSAEQSPFGRPTTYGYWNPSAGDCESFSSDDDPEGSCDGEEDDRTDRNDLRALEYSKQQLAGSGGGSANPEQKLSGLPSAQIRNVQAEEEAILDEKTFEPNHAIRELLAKLYYRRGHLGSMRLLDLLPMLRMAYSLIYGLLGRIYLLGDTSTFLHGEKLGVEEHGNFLLAEFDCLIDAFEAGLCDLERFLETPTSCAVQRSTFVALLYALARAMGCGTERGWRKNLEIARSYLLEIVDFTYPTERSESRLFREAISPHHLSQQPAMTDFERQQYVAIALILRRWEFIYTLTPRMDFSFSFDEPYPQLVFFDGDDWIRRVPNDLRLVAGPYARCFGAGMDEQLNSLD